jgi:hypothetical protein
MSSTRRRRPTELELERHGQRRLAQRGQLGRRALGLQLQQSELQLGEIGEGDRQLVEEGLKDAPRERPVHVGQPALGGLLVGLAAQHRLQQTEQQRQLGAEQHPAVDRRDVDDARHRAQRQRVQRVGPRELDGVA